nr:MAG TPA: hypothetical protein [Caudoviricetes sp.]
MIIILVRLYPIIGQLSNKYRLLEEKKKINRK